MNTTIKIESTNNSTLRTTQYLDATLTREQRKEVSEYYKTKEKKSYRIPAELKRQRARAEKKKNAKLDGYADTLATLTDSHDKQTAYLGYTEKLALLEDTKIICHSEKRGYTTAQVAVIASNHSKAVSTLKMNMAMYLDVKGDLFQEAYVALLTAPTLARGASDADKVSYYFGIATKAVTRYIASLDHFDVYKADRLAINDIVKESAVLDRKTGKVATIDRRTARKLLNKENREVPILPAATSFAASYKWVLDIDTKERKFETPLLQYAKSFETVTKKDIEVLEKLLAGTKTIQEVRHSYKKQADKLENVISQWYATL